MINEIRHIRELAHRVAEIAHSSHMQKLKKMWARHNNLEKIERPPVMCRPGGAWGEIIPHRSLISTDPLYQGIEFQLRRRLYKIEIIDDDEVVEPWVDIPAVPRGADRRLMWGVNIDVHYADQSGGSFIFNPQIKDEKDIDRLKVPDSRINEKATWEHYEKAKELLDGILQVRIAYGQLLGADLAYWGSYLRGLEQMMYDCMDRPEWLHHFMKFLSDAHIQHLKGLESDGHIVRNDIGDCNSVCLACEGFPLPDFNPNRVRLTDTWGAGDSQEFTLVSPKQWDEFLLAYQIPIFNLHGLVTYGCCESLVGKIEILKAKIPNLRRVTVSPWSDIEHTARICQNEVVMQIRPMPSDVLMKFDEDDMRKDIVRKMDAAGDTIYDFCLQDIETVNNQPQVLKTWTRVAKEIGFKMYPR